MVMWTVLTLIFVPGLAFVYGINGAAMGYSIVGLSSIVAIYITSKYIEINFLESVFRPLSAALVMGVIIFFARLFLPPEVTSIILLVLIGVIAYLGVLFLIARDIFLLDLKKVIVIFKTRKLI